jgi:pullulanase
MAEVPDPYVHAVGLNGERGALLDPATASPTQVVIGEVHVRDLTMHHAPAVRGGAQGQVSGRG